MPDTIVTVYEHPPIPDRNFDFYAYDSASFDPEPGCKNNVLGWGPTREDAIADLREQMEEING